MNLIDALWQAGYQFTLAGGPGATAEHPDGIPVRRMQLTLTPPRGKTLSFAVPLRFDLESAFALLMRSQLPEDPVYRRWLDEEQGQHRVKLVRNALPSLAWNVHTALRKRAEGTSSRLTWNALHDLSREDNRAVYEAVRKGLQEAFSQKGVYPLRRHVAELVEHHVKKAVSELTLDVARQTNAGASTRTPAQILALQMFEIGVDCTPRAEWMYAWIGYLVSEAPTPRARKRPTVGKKTTPRSPPKRARRARRVA